MPKLTKEGAFSSDVKSAINGILQQFGQLGLDPTVSFPDVPVAGGYFFYRSVASGLTALSGGGQSGATPLTGSINVVSTVAADDDSVVLPATRPGLEIVVVNGQAVKKLNVYPASGDAINAASANTALELAVSSKAMFVCAAGGHWYAIVSA